MKKHSLFFIYLFVPVLSLLGNNEEEERANQPISIIWEMGDNEIESGYYENTFYIINHTSRSLDKKWAIYFCQKQSIPRNENDLPLTVERINPTFYKMSPSDSYKSIEKGDTLKITFRSRGSIIKTSAAPEGAYIITLDENSKESLPIDIPIKIIPFTRDAQWSRKNANELPYPSATLVYDENILFNKPINLDRTDIFPSIKSVKYLNGDFLFSQNIQLNYAPSLSNEAELLKNKLTDIYNCTVSNSGNTIINLKEIKDTAHNEEYYQLIFNNGAIDIIGTNSHAIFNGTQTLLAILGNDKLPITLPNLQIEDYPDVLHRGLMLDVARNFSTKKDIFKLIDILSTYKMNVLHLHLSDDEGWRIEIPGIEELTSIGSKRGHTVDELECMFPAYNGGWDANDLNSVANGYYSRKDFIEILQYAKKRHITIIPEIDLPGHARAAIVAMKARYHKYKDIDIVKAEEYLLSEVADTSKYVSAQSYKDNVINVALPSTYRFVDKVINELDLMYADAGLKLTVFHLGGDEVPRGAWEGSPAAKELMSNNNILEIRGLKDYFVEQTLDILNEKNIQLGAWQEVALLPNKTANQQFANENVLSYCWNTIPEWKGDEIPYNLTNANYPIILCNISNFYLDLAYNKHQDEPGAYWAGYVNEYNSFNMLPYDIYKSVNKTLNGSPIDLRKASEGKTSLNNSARNNIKGIQGQLWSETIRSFDMVEYYLFPKMYGLIERSWNTQPIWGESTDKETYEKALSKYNEKIATKGMPILSQQHVNFRVPHPGLKIKNGMLYANSSISESKIRYTTDGSEPTILSPIWAKPILCNAKIIKAKTFYLNKKSVTTHLYQ